MTIGVYASDRFPLPLPSGHRFPIEKYALLRECVVATLDGRAAELRVPAAASDVELCRVHTPAYVTAVAAGTLPPAALRRIGFPWSSGLVERSRRSVGATIGACRSALATGTGVNLAGGTHHALPDRGEGYCVFNDVAVAIRVLQAEHRVRRVLVIDCDVHQGNGTAAIFRGDPTVCTLDVFSAANFPFEKEPSDLDVPLPDGTGDAAYLAAVTPALERALARRPDLAVYVAGADAFAGDRLGRLALTMAGLEARDRLVLTRLRAAAIPVAVVMGGGYARDIADTVAIHAATVRVALDGAALVPRSSGDGVALA